MTTTQSTHMDCYLAIDQGTHASRAILFDEYGDVLSGAVCDISLQRIDAQRVEQDATEILASVRQVVAEVVADIDADSQIKACGIATQRSTMLAWNSAGEARSAALSWQDVRGSDLVDALRPQQQMIQQVSGLPLSPHYGASKLRWLQQHVSGADAHLRLSPLVSYLLYHVLETKPYVVDHCNAQRTQLFDLNQLHWSDALCAKFGVSSKQLPLCVPVRYAYGNLEQHGVAVTTVTGDQNAALCGMTATQTDVALVNLGTGAFVLRHMRDYRVSQQQLTGIAVSSAYEVSYVREATINGAGSALAWLAERFDIAEIEQQLPAWLKNIKTPALFFNSVGGLGSPWWRTDIDPHFIDECTNTASDDGACVVGVIESILFMVQSNLVLMQSESALSLLRVSGGLSKLDGLCQRLADLSGLCVTRSADSEATARGAAWLAAGCPHGWQQHAEITLFRPQADAALQQRYLRFLDYLERCLAHA
ncbi:MAG: hypothetical protein KZQ96_16900 [Candidatus Thiodiazotropha sp. (ex Lucinoma borealis)]|nr:hypothetical protein [Candidatus Thiodiazotropha sp. (ex Lucinoma borealis)]MCU7868605.1 hypothetical protein [Candidatus Thiodiazotropha sp. (ex Lucinoma borealis)]